MMKSVQKRTIHSWCTSILLYLIGTTAFINSFSAGRFDANVGLMKPPIDTFKINKKGGGEYGIRQLTAVESKSTIERWQKSLGIVSGDQNIEIYELLDTLGRILKVMPGKMPQRFEYMLFGELSDGVIECISAVYCCKVTCPWEMDIILIAQSPKFSDEKIGNMVEFIRTACLENACLPNFSPLDRYSSTLQIDRFMRGQDIDEVKELDLAVAMAYQNANKGACSTICLDSIPEVYTFPYWYSMSISRPNSSISVPLYIRQTMDSMSDIQLTFTSPLSGTGTGRGTVGGALILSEFTAQRLVPDASPEYFASLKRELSKKITHPDLSHLKTKADTATRRKWEHL